MKKMIKINNCENCHHHNSLINWEEGIFYQCMYNKKMWEECDAYDPIEIDKRVYILEKYRFYEGSEIIMVSENYERVKNLFNEELRGHSKGYGYQIIEMELDKKCEEEKRIDEIEHHNEGFKVFVKNGEEVYEIRNNLSEGE